MNPRFNVKNNGSYFFISTDWIWILYFSICYLIYWLVYSKRFNRISISYCSHRTQQQSTAPTLFSVTFATNCRSRFEKLSVCRCFCLLVLKENLQELKIYKCEKLFEKLNFYCDVSVTLFIVMFVTLLFEFSIKTIVT